MSEQNTAPFVPGRIQALADTEGISTEQVVRSASGLATYLNSTASGSRKTAEEKPCNARQRLAQLLRLLLIVLVIGLAGFEFIEWNGFKPSFIIGWPLGVLLSIVAISIGIFGWKELGTIRSRFIFHQQDATAALGYQKAVPQLKNRSSLIYDTSHFIRPAEEQIVKQFHVTMRTFKTYRATLAIATIAVVITLNVLGIYVTAS